MGKTYKPETNLTVGSASVRLYNELVCRHVQVSIWYPFVDGSNVDTKTRPAVFAGTRHLIFADFEYPPGSIVVDPFVYVKELECVQVIRVGWQ